MIIPEIDLQEKQDEIKVLKQDLKEIDLQIEHAKSHDDMVTIREAEGRKKGLIIYMQTLDLEIKELSAILKEEELPHDGDRENRDVEGKDQGRTGAIGKIAGDD